MSAARYRSGNFRWLSRAWPRTLRPLHVFARPYIRAQFRQVEVHNPGPPTMPSSLGTARANVSELHRDELEFFRPRVHPIVAASRPDARSIKCGRGLFLCKILYVPPRDLCDWRVTVF